MKLLMCERSKGAITSKWLAMNTSNNDETLFATFLFATDSKQPKDTLFTQSFSILKICSISSKNHA